LAERLPETTIVSIGHRSTLLAYHERRVELRQGADQAFRPMDAQRETAPA
ncbi:MAG: transporter, partial [Enterovirga sp.]|nr:transporter [Enterovirga sp.]